MNDNALLDKFALAKYVVAKHNDKFETEITPIKLQKALYFLFAYWGGLIARGQKSNDLEISVDEFHKYLFNAKFEAWTYGPVETDVYNWYKKLNNASECNSASLSFSDDIPNNEIKMASDFIDELLDRIFATSDFGLVDLSHKDSSWKNARNRADQLMKNDEIINDHIND